MPRTVKRELTPLGKEHQGIGTRLATIRKKRRMTQTQLAKLIGISQYLVSNYETGRLHLSDEMLIRLANALKTSTDLILGLKDDVQTDSSTSLRIQKRLAEIEKLPPADQRALLRNIDMFLRAAKTENVNNKESKR